MFVRSVIDADMIIDHDRWWERFLDSSNPSFSPDQMMVLDRLRERLRQAERKVEDIEEIERAMESIQQCDPEGRDTVTDMD